MSSVEQEFVNIAKQTVLDLNAIREIIRTGKLTAHDLLSCLIELQDNTNRIIELFQIEELQTIAMSEDNYVLRTAIDKEQLVVVNALLQMNAFANIVFENNKLYWIIAAVQAAQINKQFDSLHVFLNIDVIKKLLVNYQLSDYEVQRSREILILAVHQGDIESIDAILTIPTVKSNVFDVPRDKTSGLLVDILQAAITADNAENAEKIIRKFMQISQTKEYMLGRHEILLWAIKNKHADIVDQFSPLINNLIKDYSPNDDTIINNLLIEAAKQGDIAIINSLFKIEAVKKAFPIIKNPESQLDDILYAATIDGMSYLPQTISSRLLAKEDLLLWAVKNQHAEIIYRLLKDTTFMHAITNDQTEIFNKILITAVNDNDVAMIQTLKTITESLNIIIPYSFPILRHFALRGNLQLVNALLELTTFRRDVIEDSKPLVPSNLDDKFQMMRKLLDISNEMISEKFDVMSIFDHLASSAKLTKDNYNILLQDAIKYNNAPAVKKLLEIEAVQQLVAEEAQAGNAKKLIDSMQLGNTEIAEAIYALQLPKLISTDSLNLVIQSAAEQNMVSIIRKLLTDTDIKNKPEILMKTIEDASVYERNDVILELYKTGCLTEQDELNDEFIIAAIKIGFTDLLKLLLTNSVIVKKVNENPEFILKAINSAIRHKYNNHNDGVILELLNIAPVVNMLASSIDTLNTAIRAGNSLIVKKLLPLIANNSLLNEANAIEQTKLAIIDALVSGHHEVVMELLKIAPVADILQLKTKTDTLKMAICNGVTPIAKKLLQTPML